MNRLYQSLRLGPHIWKKSGRSRSLDRPFRCQARIFSRSLSKDAPSREPPLDEEFRSIMNDFARDFNVTEDSMHILNDIKKSLDETMDESKDNHDRRAKTLSRFKEFSEQDSVVIPSAEELARRSILPEDCILEVQPSTKEFLTEDQLKRGTCGVFDVCDLVSAVRSERCRDIAVLSLPRDCRYADHLVVATVRSQRHLVAAAENINKQYKVKKSLKDPFLLVQGGDTSDWKVLDMGNIVLHLMSEETRSLYDLESLWLLDQEFGCREVLQQQTDFSTLLTENAEQTIPKS